MISRVLGKDDTEVVDPDEVALRATLSDLRRVSSEMHETNAALSLRVSKMKEGRA